MKASRGRLSQYALLNSVEGLSRHLVETKLFTEAFLYDFIEKYGMFVVKPVFGSDEIVVFSENNTIRVSSKTNASTFTEKKDVYQYLLQNEIKQKYYVMKPAKMNSRYSQRNCQYLVTVHRKSASHEWYLRTYTEKMCTTNGRGIFKYFRREIRYLSMLAAKKLGESFPDCHTIVIEIVYDMKEGIWIHDTVLHLARSKWNQYMTLIENDALKPYVPYTDLLTEASFMEFLTRNQAVIIKPCDGQNGLGIIQISSNHNHSYIIHEGIKKYTKSTLEETYQFITEKYLTNKHYIIQRKIPLALNNGCPFDCRVIVQKVDDTWKTTGKIVKVAGEGFFITNAAQELISLETAIQNSNLSHIPIHYLEEKINVICMIAARELEKNKAGIKIIGFDIGITKRVDVWIIEGNDKPDLSMFYQSEDKKMDTNIDRREGDSH